MAVSWDNLKWIKILQKLINRTTKDTQYLIDYHVHKTQDYWHIYSVPTLKDHSRNYLNDFRKYVYGDFTGKDMNNFQNPRMLTKVEYLHLKNLDQSGFPDKTVSAYKIYYGKDIFAGDYFDYLRKLGPPSPTSQSSSNASQKGINASVQLVFKNGYITISSNYDPLLVQAIKGSVPVWQRRWCKLTKRWYVDQEASQNLTDALSYHSIVYSSAGNVEDREIKNKEVTIEYIDKESNMFTYTYPNSSTGYRRSGPKYRGHKGFTFQKELFWIEHDALDSFFKAMKTPTPMAGSLYERLGLTQNASYEEIRKSYLKLAMAQHPDQGGNHEAFIAIQSAYNKLKDPLLRKKHDASLKMLAAQGNNINQTPFTMKKNCGRISAQGFFWLGIFIINQINNWEDVVQNGKTMHSVFNPLIKNYEVTFK
jgi:hypothetical protein